MIGAPVPHFPNNLACSETRTKKAPRVHVYKATCMLGIDARSATREILKRSGHIVELVEVHSPVDHSLKDKTARSYCTTEA